MNNNDPFDFGAFMRNAQNPDPELRRETTREGVSDLMDAVMAEVGPRIWCVLQQEMAKDPKNGLHLNAVLNAGIFSLLAWTVACTPKGETNGADNHEMLTEKITANLKAAIENRTNEGAEQLAFMAANVGRLKLTEDACKDLGKVITANSMIIKGVHQEIQNWRKER